MSIHLDHLMVPARDKIAAARLLAELLGVPWSATGVGPFAPVFVNDGFTIDFDEWPEPIPLVHYCFRVSEAEFHAILARIQAAAFRTAALCMARWTGRWIRPMVDASCTGTSQMATSGRC